MSINTSKPSRPSRNNFNSRNAEFSASGKYRRRGRRNRFATQASRDNEPERIIALMTQGMKVPDIAEAMKMSIATVYRRINAMRLPQEAISSDLRAKHKKMAAALLTLLQANTARAHALAAERMEKRTKVACCPECARSALAIESVRLFGAVQKIEIAYLKQLGVLDIIRASGCAAEIIRAARTLQVPEKVLRGAADNSGTSAVV